MDIKWPLAVAADGDVYDESDEWVLSVTAMRPSPALLEIIRRANAYELLRAALQRHQDLEGSCPYDEVGDCGVCVFCQGAEALAL